MPKLNVTVDQIELTTNKVFGTPQEDWTDEQYPSAKTLYDAIASLANTINNVSLAQQDLMANADFVFTDGTLYINTK